MSDIKKQIDVSGLAEGLAKAVFEEAGMAVGLVERDVAVHPYVHLNGIRASDGARAEIVEPLELRVLLDDAPNFLLDGRGQTLFEEFVQRAAHDFHCGEEDEDADDSCRNGVEHSP